MFCKRLARLQIPLFTEVLFLFLLLAEVDKEFYEMIEYRALLKLSDEVME